MTASSFRTVSVVARTVLVALIFEQPVRQRAVHLSISAPVAASAGINASDCHNFDLAHKLRSVGNMSTKTLRLASIFRKSIGLA